ncbi:RRP12-like protein [Tanacetum coccineum]
MSALRRSDNENMLCLMIICKCVRKDSILQGKSWIRKMVVSCMIALASCSCIRAGDDFKVYALNLEDARDLSEANIWLLPILKQNIIVYFIWSLLPSFCNYPLDTAETSKDLETTLCRSLQEEDDQAVLRYTSEVAACNLDVLRSSAREILCTLSEANKKTRNRSYEIIVQIGHAVWDQETVAITRRACISFQRVAGGLAGETPHMISAAVKGIAGLTYEFFDLISKVFNVLPSATLSSGRYALLLQAVLGLLKVLVAKSHAEGLQTHMRGMVETLLSLQGFEFDDHMFEQVKQLLEMLVKKCGLDAVKEVMPEEHMKNRKRKLQSDEEEPEIDAADGQLIIREDETTTLKRDMQTDSVVRSSHLTSVNSRKAEKRRKTTTKSGWAYTARWLRAKPDPRAAARKGMSSVVKLSKTLEGQSVSRA